jgi:hypothetical protein
MQEKGLERQMAFVLLKVGNRSENGNGCARKSTQGMVEERWLHRYTRMKGDRKGKITVFL